MQASKSPWFGLLIAAALLTAAVGRSAIPQSSVTLAWNPSAGSNIAGYRLDAGVATHIYTTLVDTGTNTTGSVSALLPGSTYFFAVTAYTTDGLESGYSSEISYLVPGATNNLARLQLSPGANGRFVLSGLAPVSYIYDVLATSDFLSWSLLGSVTAGTSGGFQFTDSSASTTGRRFYRLRQTFP